MVLVVVSAVLLLHHRSLPADFGAVPGAAAGAAQTASSAGVASAPSSAATTPSPAAIAPPQSDTSSRPVPAPRPALKATTTTRTTAARATTVTGSPAPASPAPTTTRRPAPAPHTAPTDARDLPRRLLLPRFGVRADVLTVASTDGTLAVPDDPQQVGWWAGSALPGSAAGTTVLDGHIDSATAGVGALIHLSELGPGDRVEILGSTGRTLRYDVVARRVYAKNVGLPSSLFTRDGPARLLLISCGGPFDAARGSYEDNIVVFATPAAH